MNQVFIMMNGFSLSGKTHLAKKIEKKFPKIFARVDSTTIHNFPNKNYPIFKDDNTIKGYSYDLRHKTTKAVHNTLIETLLKEGVSVILDSCNSKKEKRQKLLEMAKGINKEIKTIIISVNIPEKELYKRLRRYDRKNIKNGEKPAWVDLYENIQKRDFEIPTKKEADYLLNYKSGQEEKILGKLSQIIERGEKPKRNGFTSTMKQSLISLLVAQYLHEIFCEHLLTVGLLHGCKFES